MVNLHLCKKSGIEAEGLVGAFRTFGAPVPLTYGVRPQNSRQFLPTTFQMQIEHRIAVNAPPETIYRIYEDVKNWHTWDPDTKQATLDGAFQVGARGCMFLRKAIQSQWC